MTDCGCGHDAMPAARERTRVLIFVLPINTLMFVVEAVAGFAARSTHWSMKR